MKIWPARHVVKEQIGHGEAEDEFQRQRDHGDEHRMRQRPPEAGVLEQVLVVVEAREGGVRVHHVDAHEGDDEGVDQREQADQQQQEDGGRHQPVLEVPIRMLGGYLHLHARSVS